MTSALLDRPKTPVPPPHVPKRDRVRQTEAPTLACADVTHDLPRPSQKPAASSFAIVEGLFALARVWRERQRIRRQLADMSERELQDVGMCRSDIACEVAKPFWCALAVSNATR